MYWQPTKMQIGSQSSNLSAWPRRHLSHGSRPGLSVMGRGGSLIQSQIMGIFMAANRQIITSEKRWVGVKGSSVLVATPGFHPSVHCYGTTDIKMKTQSFFARLILFLHSSSYLMAWTPPWYIYMIHIYHIFKSVTCDKPLKIWVLCFYPDIPLDLVLRYCYLFYLCLHWDCFSIALLPCLATSDSLPWWDIKERW